MKIGFNRKGSTLVIMLEGELDQHNSESIRTAMDAEIKRMKYMTSVVIDLEGLTFMDSSGIGVILGRYKLISSLDGRLSVINASRRVERILKMAGVYALLERQDRRAN